MAAGSNVHTGVLWRIAKNSLISQDPCWEELEFFLEENKVDPAVQKPEDWKKSFEEIRRKIESIKNSPAATAERPSLIESERQPDNTSVSDSGYHSDKNDQFDTIFALFEGNDDFPEGRAPLTCYYSDKYDESYITETICERLALHAGKDGKVNLTYVLSGEVKSVVEKCIIRKYEDGDADVGFRVKKSEEIGKADVEERDEDIVTGMHQIDDHHGGIPSRSREASALQQRIYDHEVNLDISVAVGFAFRPQAAQAHSDEDCMHLGRKIGLALNHAKAAQYPIG